MNLKNIINETNFNRDGRVLRSLEKAKKNSGQPYGDTATKKIFNLFSRDDQRMNSDRDRQKVDGAVVRRPKSIFREGVGLKEYYKEILNNLLMTEVTASPKVGSTPWAKPVEPGSKRAVALGGLQAEHQRLKSAGDTAIGGNNPADYSRMKRIENTLAAKGADTKGNLNVHGHAIRTRDAALSNSYRLGTSGNPNAQVKDNDKRTPEQKQGMRNTASVGRRSEPGADD